MKDSTLWQCFLTFCRALGLLLLILISLTGVLMQYAQLQQGKTALSLTRSDSFVLTKVHLLTMQNEHIVQDQTLIVRNGRIVALQPASLPYPDDLPVINGDGRYVMPGLIDLHVHILDRSYAKSALAAGVTTVRNMGGFNYQLKWRDELNAEKWYGAKLVLASPVFNSMAEGDPLSHFRVDEPHKARQAVKDYIEDGYDFIKVYEGLNADVYSVILDEAISLGVAVAGHPSYDLMAKNPRAHSALRSFEHSEEVFDGFLNQTFDEEEVLKAAEFLRDYDITLVPTLAVNRELTRLSVEKQSYMDSIDADAINPFVRTVYQQTSFKRWLEASEVQGEYNQQVDKFLGTITLEMFKNGVTIGLGSDAGALTGLPGPASIDEVLLLVESGMPVYEVLRTATVNAAKVVGKASDIGQIAEGYIADLVVLNENPMEEIHTLTSPEMVIQDGKVFTHAELRQLRKESHLHMGWLLSLLRHLYHLLFG